MILHWNQLELFYGSELATHRWRFEKAHNSTYGVLCCRLARGDDKVRANGEEHAEARLLKTDLWTEDIPQELADWTPRNSPIVTTMAVNRSPCRNCSEELITALNDLRRSVTSDKNRFILAATGKYWGSGPGALTLVSDLRHLKEAGWELAVLQVGNSLSERGEELLLEVQRLSGRGYVRLSS